MTLLDRVAACLGATFRTDVCWQSLDLQTRARARGKQQRRPTVLDNKQQTWLACENSILFGSGGVEPRYEGRNMASSVRLLPSSLLVCYPRHTVGCPLWVRSGLIRTIRARPLFLLGSGSIELVTQQGTPDHEAEDILTLRVSARLQRVGREMKMLVENTDDQTKADPALLRIVARGHDIQERLLPRDLCKRQIIHTGIFESVFRHGDYVGEPDWRADRGTYAPPDVSIRYPAPAYGRPDYRDVARYCEPDDGTVAAGYIPPAWCFPARPGASGPIDLPAASIYGPRYPTPGYAHRRAPHYYGNDPYRARYGKVGEGRYDASRYHH